MTNQHYYHAALHVLALILAAYVVMFILYDTGIAYVLAAPLLPRTCDMSQKVSRYDFG